MAYKGKYKVKNPNKYLGNVDEVTYRSSWEKEVMMFLDNNDDIVEWGSEELAIPYENPVRGKTARYFPDFIIKHKSGRIKVVEVKPAKETVQPEKPQRRTKKYIEEVATWAINSEKWKAARQLCEKNDLDFEIWTEDTLKNMGLLKATGKPKKEFVQESKRPKMIPMVKRKPRPRPKRRS